MEERMNSVARSELKWSATFLRLLQACVMRVLVVVVKEMSFSPVEAPGF